MCAKIICVARSWLLTSSFCQNNIHGGETFDKSIRIFVVIISLGFICISTNVLFAYYLMISEKMLLYDLREVFSPFSKEFLGLFGYSLGSSAIRQSFVQVSLHLMVSNYKRRQFIKKPKTIQFIRPLTMERCKS